jgi:hypothetical protein
MKEQPIILDADGNQLLCQIHYERAVLGECVGLLLFQRALDDNHVCLQWIVEDDGTWYVPLSRFSSFWIVDSINVLQKALKWLNENCAEDLLGYGYVFKKGTIRSDG